MIHNQIPSRQKFKISPAESMNYLMLRYVKDPITALTAQAISS